MGKVRSEFPSKEPFLSQPFPRDSRLHVQAVSQSSSNQCCRPHPITSLQRRPPKRRNILQRIGTPNIIVLKRCLLVHMAIFGIDVLKYRGSITYKYIDVCVYIYLYCIYTYNIHNIQYKQKKHTFSQQLHDITTTFLAKSTEVENLSPMRRSPAVPLCNSKRSRVFLESWAPNWALS